MVLLRHWRVGSHTGLAGAQDYPATYIRFYEGTKKCEDSCKEGASFLKWGGIQSLMEGTKQDDMNTGKIFYRIAADWTLIGGDWNGDGIDTIGVYRNSNTPGNTDLTLVNDLETDRMGVDQWTRI
jgi:hypothetical protein